jgi:hypothetical protein
VRVRAIPTNTKTPLPALFTTTIPVPAAILRQARSGEGGGLLLVERSVVRLDGVTFDHNRAKSGRSAAGRTPGWQARLLWRHCCP